MLSNRIFTADRLWLLCQRCQPSNIYPSHSRKKNIACFHPRFPWWFIPHSCHSYIFPTNPHKSLVFQYLTYCQITYKVVTFTSKQSQIMGLHTILMGIIPDRLYTVNEAARYLCVHRCTIYAYINHQEKPLPFVRQQSNMRILFQGCDLTAYKASGLPKKGRKRKGGIQ